MKIKCDRCGKECEPDKGEINCKLLNDQEIINYNLCVECCEEVKRFIVEGRYYDLD